LLIETATIIIVVVGSSVVEATATTIIAALIIVAIKFERSFIVGIEILVVSRKSVWLILYFFVIKFFVPILKHWWNFLATFSQYSDKSSRKAVIIGCKESVTTPACSSTTCSSYSMNVVFNSHRKIEVYNETDILNV